MRHRSNGLSAKINNTKTTIIFFNILSFISKQWYFVNLSPPKKCYNNFLSRIACEFSHALKELVEDLCGGRLPLARPCVRPRASMVSRTCRSNRAKPFVSSWKTLLRYFRLGNLSCGFRAAEKMFSVPPTLISLTISNCQSGMQKRYDRI